MHGNATETVIAATATPVKVAGTFIVGDVSGYTGDTTGRITQTVTLRGISLTQLSV
jgi:hypothetical protein